MSTYTRPGTDRPTASVRALRRAAVFAAGTLALLTGLVPPASAAPPATVWNVTQLTHPTVLAPGGTGTINVVVTNLGDGPAAGPVTVTAQLPTGLTAVFAGDGFQWDCPAAAGAAVVTCTLNDLFAPTPYANAPQLTIGVSAGPRGSGQSVVTVSGGGAASGDSSTRTVVVSDEPTEYGIASFDAWAVNSDGSAATQAGSHADVTTDIQLNTAEQDGRVGPAGNAKEIVVDLPQGLVGSPAAVASCSRAAIANRAGPLCAPETQVGTVDVSLGFGSVNTSERVPVFNVEPPPGRPARFAFNILGVVTNIDATVRTGDGYGIRAVISGISQTLAITGSRLTLWAIPAEATHDAWRWNPDSFTFGIRSNAPRVPFMTVPTSCSGQALETHLATASWERPTDFHHAAVETDFDGAPAKVDGCERVPFEPTFALRPDSPAHPGAPVGLTVDLGVPQNDSPDGLAPAHLRTAQVTLPPGIVVNPSSADGLQACELSAVRLYSAAPAVCPDAAKLGTLEIVTPLLRESLAGHIYLAAQRRNPFNTTLAMYLVASGSGVELKLPGRIDADPLTGRLVVRFDDNPQLPFERLSLHFKTGPRAPLSLPRSCGAATTTAELVPWSGTAPVTLHATFAVSHDGRGAPCPPSGFAPKFDAGVVNPAGGMSSPLSVAFARNDIDQEFSGMTVRLPRGLVARVADVPLCPATAAAAGSCGEASRIGSVTTAAGAGTNPLSLPGRVYLSGPYKGAPFGLSIVVPAVAGPFDLGVVVVRAAIFVDRTTAELRVDADPLPSILEGIPLQIRLVDVVVNRPRFVVNPTNCTRSVISGRLTSTAGAVAEVASRFQVGSCATLPFRPIMRLTVGASGKTARGKRTPLAVSLSMTPGQTNNRSVQVTLPKTVNARLDVVNRRRACTFEQFRADRCPVEVGTGTAITPLLRDPLIGPAYFVFNPDRRLPDLVIRLKGQLAFDLVGKVAITRDLRLRTTFDTVPDVPITKFRLRLASGSRNGPVGLTRDVCKPTIRRTLNADLAFVAQSNRRVQRAQRIAVEGCGRVRSERRRTGRSRAKR